MPYQGGRWVRGFAGTGTGTNYNQHMASTYRDVSGYRPMPEGGHRRQDYRPPGTVSNPNTLVSSRGPAAYGGNHAQRTQPAPGSSRRPSSWEPWWEGGSRLGTANR